MNKIELRNFSFTPVIVEGMMDYRLRKNEQLNWWSESRPFQYNASLISAYYGMRTFNFREKYNFPSDFILVGDSGGLQSRTQNWREEVIKILRWQERNVDIGLSFDVSPKLAVAGKIGAVDLNSFKDCCAKSHRYYEIMERNRESNNLKLLKVIHGSDVERFKYWYNQMKDIKMDGLSISSTYNDAWETAFQLAYVLENDECNYIHNLLGTGINTLPLLVYASKRIKHLTFDSSTYALGMSKRLYFMPYSTNVRVRLNDSGILFLNSNKYEIDTEAVLPCDCPICRTAKNYKTLTNNSLSRSRRNITGMLISMHNLYIFLRYLKFMDRLIDTSSDFFMEFVKQNHSKKCYEALIALNYSLEQGFDKANKKYYKEFMGHSSVTRQGTI